MRTKRELLELLLEEWEKTIEKNGRYNSHVGLCNVILFCLNISKKEKKILINLINENMIKSTSIFYMFSVYEHQARVDWIKQQIDLCEEK